MHNGRKLYCARDTLMVDAKNGNGVLQPVAGHTACALMLDATAAHRTTQSRWKTCGTAG